MIQEHPALPHTARNGQLPPLQQPDPCFARAYADYLKTQRKAARAFFRSRAFEYVSSAPVEPHGLTDEEAGLILADAVASGRIVCQDAAIDELLRAHLHNMLGAKEAFFRGVLS